MSNTPIFSYKQHLDDKVRMTQTGTIDAGQQAEAPVSAGSRGLRKTKEFVNDKTQMTMGESITMEDIKTLISKIDGLNTAVTEDNNKLEYTKVMLDISTLKDRIERLSVDNDAKVSAIQSLTNAEEALVALDESYEPFPEEDEITFEDDDQFYEAFGELGFPEDETELFDAEYQGRKVPLNKPMRGDVKKFKVYVKDPKTGNVKKVNFGHGGSSARKAGQKTMKIRKSNPKARKSFRARHNCANPGPKTKARYWSCRAW